MVKQSIQLRTKLGTTHIEAPTRKKAPQLCIFAAGGGGLKTESKPFEELFEEPFFSLSLDIFKKKGGGRRSKI